MSKEEIIDKILKTEESIHYVRAYIDDLREKITDAETRLIGHKLDLEKYQEELRVFVARLPDKSMTDRQKEIKDFKDKFPLMKEKVK
jgi:regulator of replication initiation timing